MVKSFGVPILLGVAVVVSGAAWAQEEAAGDRVIVNSVGMKLKALQPGSFVMGAAGRSAGADESPQHEVTIAKPFYMGVYEVTQEEYEGVMGSNPSKFEGAKQPVDSVSWDEAQAFCEKLGELEKAEYRLPTEAEWEYACRAGTRTEYYWGDEYSADHAWSDRNSRDATHPVGTRRPNPWGLFDMSGNVFEWCGDFYAESYPGAEPLTDPTGPETGTHRILRGGAWFFFPEYCRSSARFANATGKRNPFNGFRVVRVP